jgi:hypothetical protein
MGIDVHRDIDTAMTEQFLYQFWMDPLAEEMVAALCLKS